MLASHISLRWRMVAYMHIGKFNFTVVVVLFRFRYLDIWWSLLWLLVHVLFMSSRIFRQPCLVWHYELLVYFRRNTRGSTMIVFVANNMLKMMNSANRCKCADALVRNRSDIHRHNNMLHRRRVQWSNPSRIFENQHVTDTDNNEFASHFLDNLWPNDASLGAFVCCVSEFE